MANTITNEVRKYLVSLNATDPICVSLGTSFTTNTTLFEAFEPINATKCVSVIPYSAGSPSPEGDRQISGVQIRIKARKRQVAYETQQLLINRLHGNESVCASQNGKVWAVQSAPIILDVLESGKYIRTVSNYIIKYVKL